ncbi:chorion class B protein Ld10-like [Anticarsia gemmatalis]|uniref:chorion class B protein Ld10-like n=1 Tax=Anticarsia gemmatalis TaxID=129554 RepID=UPI003F772B50
MSAKIVLVFCAQALFVQVAFSQCLGSRALATPCGLAAPALAYDGLAGPYGMAAPYGLGAPCGYAAAMDFTPTSGGGLPVSSASAIAPVGLSVASENVYEGILAAAGELPFVGTVAVEGVLPTAGAGAVNHACGNGINAMAAETTAFAPGYAAAAYAPAAALAPFGAAGIAPFGVAGFAPAAAIAPGLGLAAPALGYGAGWASRGCGCAL